MPGRKPPKQLKLIFREKLGKSKCNKKQNKKLKNNNNCTRNTGEET